MLKNLVKKFKTHSLNEEEIEGTKTANSEIIAENGNHEYNRVTTRNFLVRMKGVSDVDFRASKNHRNQMATVAVKGNCPLCSKSSLDLATDFERDSGTESDEELEQIETNSTHSVPISQTSDYYASQQSLSASCRSSHCGSPLFGGLSDQECNSWDTGLGNGGESHGTTTMTSQCNNSQYVDGDTLTPLELPNHHYHTRQQFKRFVKQHQTTSLKANTNMQISLKNGIFTNEDEDKTNSDGAREPSFLTPSYNHHHRRALTLTAAPVTAFVPVRRLRSDPVGKMVSALAEDDELSGDETKIRRESEPSVEGLIDDGNRGRSSSLTNGASEKRKWSQVRNSGSYNCVSGTLSYNQGQNNGYFFDVYHQNSNRTGCQQRPLLTAARKTPVKFLIPPKLDSNDVKNAEKISTNFVGNSTIDGFQTQMKPRKKCRHNFDEDESSDEQRHGVWSRPSLNFEKMREKLVKPSKKKIQHYNSLNSQSKLKASPNGYQLRSSLFRPVYHPTALGTNPPSSWTGAPSDSTPNLHSSPNLAAAISSIGVV